MGRREPPLGLHPVPLYYSNPDIVYANEFPSPRFGQGCFAAALNAVYAAVRGCTYLLHVLTVRTYSAFTFQLMQLRMIE